MQSNLRMVSYFFTVLSIVMSGLLYWKVVLMVRRRGTHACTNKIEIIKIYREISCKNCLLLIFVFRRLDAMCDTFFRRWTFNVENHVGRQMSTFCKVSNNLKLAIFRKIGRNKGK